MVQERREWIAWSLTRHKKGELKLLGVSIIKSICHLSKAQHAFRHLPCALNVELTCTAGHTSLAGQGWLACWGPCHLATPCNECRP